MATVLGEHGSNHVDMLTDIASKVANAVPGLTTGEVLRDVDAAAAHGHYTISGREAGLIANAAAPYARNIHLTPGEKGAVVQAFNDYVTVDNHNGPRPGCPRGNCGPVLGPHDIVGTTFYIACNMMLAFTAFFFVQVSLVPKQWRTSVSVAGLVTGVAWYNYTNMKDQWVHTQSSPTNYRYTDWLITVPLQICEFYFILKAAGPVDGGLGLRLFSASLAMVFFGWLAEIDVMAKLVGFTLGMACWLYIVYEVTAGSAAAQATKMTTKSSKAAFASLRSIVTFGWTIYPIGFAIAYLCFFDQPAGNQSIEAEGALNVIYNLADLVNKGAFGLCVWSAANADKQEALLG